MLPTNGLYGHIQKNTMKSAMLLAGFVVLIMIFWYSWCVIYTVAADYLVPRFFGRFSAHAMYREPSVTAILEAGYNRALDRWMIPLIIAAGWFVIAFFIHADLIRLATRARPVTRKEEPRLYKIVERVAITAGLPMPRVEIIRSSAMNAYAAGLGPNDAVVAVSLGLLDNLTDDELEAVVAHEVTHIKNRDVRLMVVATVFSGGLTMLGEGIATWLSSGAPGGETAAGAGLRAAAHADDSSEGDESIWPVVISIVFAVIFLALTHLFAILINFAISRSREFMADAGAVELTKNPDAMISALLKISEDDEIPGIGPTAQNMMFSASVDRLLSTHPPISERVSAMQRFAGGRVMERRSRPVRAAGAQMPAAMPQPGGAVGFGRRRAVPMRG